MYLCKNYFVCVYLVVKGSKHLVLILVSIWWRSELCLSIILRQNKQDGDNMLDGVLNELGQCKESLHTWMVYLQIAWYN